VSRFEQLVAAIVTVIWAASMIVDMLVPTYEVPALVHGLMAGIVGAITGKSLVKRASRDE